jgi:hypothetical protein
MITIHQIFLWMSDGVKLHLRTETLPPEHIIATAFHAFANSLPLLLVCATDG